MPGTPNERHCAELARLLAELSRVYGYDFREYAEASLRRRMLAWLAGSGFASFEQAAGPLLGDPELFDALLRGITVNVSEMFRDPWVFKLLREQVVPHLATYPFVKIWHAGCACGEEAYSMAILLDEEGLEGRYRIYATDINRQVLRGGRDGIFALSGMRLYTENYQQGGGRRAFSDYYTAGYDHALITPRLKEGIVFAQHNLAVDGAFGEMQVVLCRNVLIYFKQPLRRRALGLFDSCLSPGGFLCLGTKETLDHTELAPHYQEMEPRSRLYRKRYA